MRRRFYLLPYQEHRRQQQACFPYLLPTMLPSSNTTGEESLSDLREVSLPGKTLQVSSTLGSTHKRPAEGMSHLGFKAHGEAEGLAKLRAPLLDVLSGSCLAPRGPVVRHSSSPSPKHQGSTCLLHHSLLITLHKERPLLMPGHPGTATQGAGWPIKSSVGLVVPPHPSPLLGISSWSVYIIPAALSVLALQRPSNPVPPLLRA